MPAPEPLYVAYDQYTAAKLWADFAGHALAGSLANSSSAGPEVESRMAARQADAMLVEFRSRFHHEGK